MILYFLTVAMFAILSSYLAYSIERNILAVILLIISGLNLVAAAILMIDEGYFDFWK